MDRDFGPLPERSLLVLANRLALALSAVHRAGLVHRDLKPSNILLAVDGPRVIDFGISRALDALTEGPALTGTGVVIGSPGFMSPEQVRGERVSAASDVFCLGAVLAFSATGRAPFGGVSEGHAAALMFRIAHEEPDLAGVPASLLPLVRACLDKDPARRPTPEEVARRTAGEVPAHGWLPPELLAQLARHSSRLLDADMAPMPRRPGYRPPAPSLVAPSWHDSPPPPPAAASAPPTAASTRARASSVRPRATRAKRGSRVRAIAALVLAALVIGWFVVRPLVGRLLADDSDGAAPSPSLGSPTFDFTGVWEGSSSGSAIRVAIAEDRTGGKVDVDILDDTRMCGGTTSVLSRKGPVLKATALSTSARQIESYVNVPAYGCENVEEQSLEAEADGTVLLSAGEYTAQMKRVEHSGAAVPAAFLGRWTRTQGAPDATSLYATFRQGALGEPLARLEGKSGNRSCVWTAVLFRVRDGQRLDFSPTKLDREHSGSGCMGRPPHTYWLQGSTLWLEPSGAEKEYVAFKKAG
ncbi:hypothetical protein A8W25_13535 [Streptomyces sp. ERV7]|uniref:protein kinase domain-containing protein n=1 Tax=Streptomyces sp. ERV7 TaxID=1322334 RepID=UPI0007F4A428|nr:serine/threonine-protein kinase [Streptomyces sp. ERV7]OAR23566.1 hypothetical protein A8W25_13535 [Streptomyces sp. ERV7]